jgi:hypothetical protein
VSQAMEDAEYSEYLKKQSYEDLLLISSSIDQERQAKRYEMVIAEIDRRDKSGEGKDSPNDPTKRYLKYISITFGILFAFLGLFEVYTGHAYNTKYFHDIALSQHPIEFWVLVAPKFVIVIIVIVLGLFRAKR